MTDHTNTYPDLVNVEDWLNAKGYTGEAGACHKAMSLIRKQEKRIAELEAALKPFDEMLQRDFSIMADDKRYADDFTSTVLMRLGDLRAARSALEKQK